MKLNEKQFTMNPGEKAKDEEKGWFIVNENGAQIFLNENKELYIETYKKYHDVEILCESFSDVAKRMIWETTNEKNG